MAVVWLASYPRSGNTFLRILLEVMYTARTYSVYDTAEHPPQPNAFGVLDRIIPPLHELAELTSSVVVKTHEMADPAWRPAVYLVRDGRDALVSYAHYIRDTIDPGRSFEEALYALIATDDSFGGWGPHVMSWLPQAACVIHFERLIRDPVETLQPVLNELDIAQKNDSGVAPPTFEYLQKLEPRFFRRGEIGAWRDELSPALHALFWERYGDAMAAAGYTH